MGEETRFYDRNSCVLIVNSEGKVVPKPTFTIHINPKRNEAYVTAPFQVKHDNQEVEMIDMLIDPNTGKLLSGSERFLAWRLNYQEYYLMRLNLGLPAVSEAEYNNMFLNADKNTLEENIQPYIPIPPELNTDIEITKPVIPPQPPQLDLSA